MSSLDRKPPFIGFSLLLILIFGLGFLIRLTDLDDPPLDFNPTRQLRSAIIARGIYYSIQDDVDPQQKGLAISHMKAMERLEPPILETVVAGFYKWMGSEQLWVSRLMSSVFWMVAAGFLYDLGRKMETSLASLFGIAYFMFLPFGIRASRSFQPDPGLVMFVIVFAWALWCWDNDRSWKWLGVAGISGCLAGLLKPAGLIFIIGMIIGVILFHGLRPLPQTPGKPVKIKIDIKPLVVLQGISLVILVIAPVFIYYTFGIRDATSDYIKNWTIFSRWRDVLSLSFALRWMIQVDHLLNIAVVFAGILGSFFASDRSRGLIWGYWGGYFIYGLAFPYHILTHDYYHLPLVGITALSLVPLVGVLNRKIVKQGYVQQFVFTAVILLFSFYNGWMGRSIILGNDYREHPQFWQEVGIALPEESKVIGITQDYGFRLMYYGWRKIELWQQGAEMDEYEEILDGAEFFLVTAKNQLDQTLRTYLDSHYPVFQSGAGYIIYDLRGNK